MRTRLIALVAIALFAVASFSFRPVSASPASQDTKQPVCTNTALLKEIGEDFTTLGKSLDGIAKLDAAGLYAQMIDISNLRHKYEDKEWPTDKGCDFLQTEVIIMLSNVQDYAVVELADKLKLDKDMIAKNREFMTKRLADEVKAITELLPKAS